MTDAIFVASRHWLEELLDWTHRCVCSIGTFQRWSKDALLHLHSRQQRNSVFHLTGSIMKRWPRAQTPSRGCNSDATSRYELLINVEGEDSDAQRKNAKVDSNGVVETIDDVIRLDRYQLILQIFNEFCIFCMMSNMVFMVFGGAQPKVDCHLYTSNVSLFLSKSIIEYEFASVAVEFNLICDQKIWTAYATSLQMIGVIIGAFISGQLSDSFGRRKVLIVNLCALASVCAMSAFSSNFRVFLLFRFIIGCFVGGVNTVWAVFIVENLPRAHRFWLCTLITWAPNYVILAFIAYFTAEWRILAFTCAVLSLPGILLLIFVIHESPHYLLEKGRSREAIDVLSAITSWNSKPISRREIAELVAWEASKKNAAKTATTIKQNTYLDLYRTRSLAIHTVVTSFGFVAANCVTYSLVFNLTIIGGSLYVNTALSGVLRYAIGIAIAIIDYMCVCAGRKIIHAGSMAVIVACLAGIVSLLHYELADIHGNLIRIFTLISFGMTGSIFTQLSLISAELFPTPLRNLANAHGNVFSRVGSAVAPSIFELAIISPDVPYILLTVISVIEILAILWGIPETKNKHLSDVLYERDYESRELNEDRNTSTKAGNVGSKSVARATRPHTFVGYEKI